MRVIPYPCPRRVRVSSGQEKVQAGAPRPLDPLDRRRGGARRLPGAVGSPANAIVQCEAVERVAYSHVELDSHDVIVAEGPRSWKRATKTVPRLPMPIGQKPSLAPTRQRERQMKQFKSASQAQRFLSAHDQINNLFHFRRDHVTAAEHRASRTQKFRVWAEICSMGWQ